MQIYIKSMPLPSTSSIRLLILLKIAIYSMREYGHIISLEMNGMTTMRVAMSRQRIITMTKQNT